MDFIERIFTDFSEIHGDRAFGDDEAVACGMARLDDQEVMVIGNRKGGSTKERVRRNFGMPNPEGYRKALRCMRIAEKFGRPVVSFIDLPGAYPGLGAEDTVESIAEGSHACADYSAAVSALVMKAKLSGHWLDRTENKTSNVIYHISDEPLSVEEWAEKWCK